MTSRRHGGYTIGTDDESETEMTTRPAPAPIFTDISTADPIEIDSHLARLGAENSSLLYALADMREALMNLRRDEPVRRAFYGKTEADLEEMIKQAQFRQAEVTHLVYPLDQEFERRGGWRRYYLVEDGHLHYDVSSSRCSRIPSTTHYWMTEFSGTAPKLVIAKAGERVCTTCFPEAPVAPRPAHPRFLTRTEAEKAAYAEAKARKAAAKKAAQMVDPETGGELRTAGGYHGDLIKTEIAARRRALSDASDIAFYGASHPSADEWRETVVRMIAALAHRTGMDVGTLRAEINGKVAKKARREGWTVKSGI